jgi:iron(III) transport system permease protein
MNGPTSNRHRRLAFAAISGLALVMALPLVVVVTAPLHSEAPEWRHVWSTMLPTHLWETLLLLAGTLGVAVLVAVPTAWLVAVYTFPGRRLFRSAMVLPLALPTYIGAFAYASLLGPTSDITNSIAAITGWRPDIIGLPGLSVVLGLALSPYVHLPVRAAFAQGMSGQLDAARSLGAGGWDRFRLIALPLARPALVGGAVLVGMETLNDYGAVKYYGVRTLTTGIFRSWQGLFDLGSALRLGLVLLGLVALLLFIERRSRRGMRHHVPQEPAPPVRLRGLRAGGAMLACSAVLLLAFVLPMGRIVADVFGPMPLRPLAEWWPALRNTLAVAVLAASTTLLVALLFTFRERHGRRPDLLVRSADLGYAVPGAVIAIGVMALAAAIDRRMLFRTALIGGIALLVYAFTVRFLAVGTRPLFAGLEQQDRHLDEAARLLGASPWRTFLRVNLPLLRPTLQAAAMLVAIDVIKELPLTLILRPFDFHTLGTWTYELASIEQLREASWPALLIVLCALVPVLTLEKVLARPLR